MSLRYDSRGFLRGSCEAQGCFCTFYNGGEDMKKCIHCGHVPGKHSQLAKPSEHGSAAAYSHQAHQYRPSQSPDRQPFHVVHTPNLPQCQAPGCYKKVHYDYSLPPDLPPFQYCSPQCRDSHLLPAEREKLKCDLKDLRGILQAVSVAEFGDLDDAKSQVPKKQPSYEKCTSSSSGVGTSKQTTHSEGKFKKQEDQATVQVEITKERFKTFGIILSKQPYSLDKVFGFLIVGAVKGSPAYLKLLDDKIRIFDVIEAVDGKTCKEILIPSMGPQISFVHHVKNEVGVKLHINRSISLLSLSYTLELAQTNRVDFTHLLTLMHPHTGTNDDRKSYGLNLSEPTYTSKFMVERIIKDTPAFYSGVEHGDRISMYVTAAKDGISDCHFAQRKDLASMLCDLRTAFVLKESVILLIQRSKY